MSSSSAARRKTVLLMIRELGIGGSERQTSMMAQSLDQRDFRVIVGAFHSEGLRRAQLNEAGIPVVEFGVRSFASPSLWRWRREFREYLQREQVSIVHPFDYGTVVFCALSTPRTGVRFISSQRSQRILLPRTYRPLVRCSDWVADTLVVNSEFLRQEMIQEEGWRPERVRLVRNAIDTDAFQPPAGPRRRPEILAGAEMVVGCVAGLRREKDLGTLMHAVQRLVPRFPGLRLLLVGSGPADEELRQLCAQLRLEQHCHFVPQTADVLPWLHSIDIFVLPSTSEALSNSLMEAMSTGAAVVASRVGGNVELVTHGANGLLFPAGDVPALEAALESLITQPAYREQLGRAARHFLTENFSARAVAASLGAVYQEPSKG
jgi:L-malate glycosyltransferase